MIKKNFVPTWLLPFLIIVFFIILILYYLISKSPRIEDLFINLATTVLGIIITLYGIDRIIKHYERKSWLDFEKIISTQIIDILFTLCNFMNLNSSLWEQWLQVFNKNITKKDKVVQYINFFHATEIDSDYIKQIVKDDHLLDFFSGGYKDTFQKLDDLFRLYSNKLTADQSTHIINLTINVSSLINDMSTFRMFNFAIKEFNAHLEVGHLKYFYDNARETISTAKKLLDSI